MMNIDELDNEMKIEEYQEWMQKGMDARDACYGLLFYACRLNLESGGTDLAIPFIMQLAQTTAILEITDELRRIRFMFEKEWQHND